MSGSPPLEADVMETRGIEDLAAKLAGILPPGLRSLRGELEDNFRAVLRANLEKWDLVSRERFDTQARSEEHTSELQSLMRISYAVFCLKKKTIQHKAMTNVLYAIKPH